MSELKWLEYLKENDPDIYAQAIADMAIISGQRDDLIVAVDDLDSPIHCCITESTLRNLHDVWHRIRREIAAEGEGVANDATENPSEEPHIIKSKTLFTLGEVIQAVQSFAKLMACPHCDWTSEYNKRDDADELIKEHIKTCPGHPMREMERKIKELEDQRGHA